MACQVSFTSRQVSLVASCIFSSPPRSLSRSSSKLETTVSRPPSAPCKDATRLVQVLNSRSILRLDRLSSRRLLSSPSLTSVMALSRAISSAVLTPTAVSSVPPVPYSEAEGDGSPPSECSSSFSGLSVGIIEARFLPFLDPDELPSPPFAPSSDANRNLFQLLPAALEDARGEAGEAGREMLDLCCCLDGITSLSREAIFPADCLLFRGAGDS
mmetsp:Transcript_69633/g.125510  ORF Transcript_69633/g.125510 Transcript_69633/m.125510 type:complete len:214 (-) Transcript_69633:87-728(-)